MGAGAERGRPVFYFDVGSPWCWIAGERVNHALGQVPEWVPVHGIGGAGADDRGAVERRAAELELPAMRWPEPFPFDSRTAMLAATFAKQSGRVVAYSLAAMRQAFAAGRDLSVADNVLIAAAACEIHPRALLKGIELRSVTEALDRATADAGARGVRELPCVVDSDGRTLPREQFV
jgi:2-hydroxychromene-2-carboxylate isomerase